MKEWYLEHTPPESTSGYENESITDYGEPNFTDILYTNVAQTVILYNSDLTDAKEIKCIVQGNTSDTQLKSMERTFLFKIGTVKAGMYIFFENRYWLIDGYPGNNGSYEKATSVLCQYKLRWQNSIGEVIERWCNITSASKYDVGEGGNNTIFLTSNNYTIKIPYDEETLNIEEKRVFIDKRAIHPTKVFKLTRNDDVLYDYGDEDHGSVLSLIADKDEFNPTVDNQELRLCNYNNSSTTSIPDSPSPQEIVVSIFGDATLRIGKTKKWTVVFLDKDGNNVEYENWKWYINENYVQKTFSDNRQTMNLIVKDDSYIDEKFEIKILSNDDEEKILAVKTVTVVEGY